MMAQSYTVKAGDTLSKIAARYGVPMSSITGYRSGNPNQIGVGEVLNVGSTPLPPVNTIDARNLNNTQSFTPPPATTPTGYAGLNGLIKSTQDNITAYNAPVQQGEKDIKEITDKLGGQATRRADLYASEGVNTAKKELLDFQNSMRAKEQKYLAKVDRIRNNNPTGALQAGQDIELDRASKDHAIESSADAITAEYKLGNYQNAKAIVDTLVDAETEDLTIKLKGLQYFYEKNYDKLSDAQKTLLTQQTNQVQNDLDEKKDLRTQIGKIQLDAAAAGAPSSVIAAIGKSEDLNGAIQNAGQYLVTAGKGSFTTTQLNSGAANAGLTSTDFNNLAPDVKNYFINNETSVKQFNQALKDIASGDSTAVDVTDEINSSALTPAVKEYLISKIPGASSSGGQSGGFWNSIGSWFGNAWRGISSRI